MMTRFNGGKWDFIVKDNHSLVISDYYNESSKNIFTFEGEEGDPPGRVVVQGAKIAFTEVAGIVGNNYAGQIFIGPEQFCGGDSRRMSIQGEQATELFLVGNTFYHAAPLDFSVSPSAKIYQLGSWPVGRWKDPDLTQEDVQAMFADSVPEDKLSDVAKELDYLRRLGAMDLKLNYPEVAPAE
jgi:hypothetical protein